MKPYKCDYCMLDYRSCPYVGKRSECPVVPYGGELVCFSYGEPTRNATDEQDGLDSEK